jgi:hypothetical protein
VHVVEEESVWVCTQFQNNEVATPTRQWDVPDGVGGDSYGWMSEKPLATTDNMFLERDDVLHSLTDNRPRYYALIYICKVR